MSARALRIRSIDCPRSSDQKDLVFNVGMNGSSGEKSRVRFTFSGSAKRGQDFDEHCNVSFDGGRSFKAVKGNEIEVPAGVSDFKVKVHTHADVIDKRVETVNFHASLNGSSTHGTGTICDRSVAPLGVRGVSSPTQTEGESLEFDVAMSATARSSTRVQLVLSEGSAKAGTDYSANMQVSFDAGKTFKPVVGSAVDVPVGASGFKIKVATIDDGQLESKETMTLKASANGSSATGIGGILDNDACPVTVRCVSSAQASEGDPLTFSVTLSASAGSATTVNLLLSNGSATEGQDYSAAGLLVSFDGGKTFQAVAGSSVQVPAGVCGFKVRVQSLEDTVHEGNETFTLKASANGGSAQGIGTICEDDAAPRVVSVGAAQANEGDPLCFAVKLSGAASSATTVVLQLANGTATAGQDYANSGLQVSFDGGRTYAAVTGMSVQVPAGVSGFTVKVPGLEDTIHEGNETFTLQASANGSNAQGIGTICEDDAAPRVLSVGSAQANEGDPLTFDVALTGTSFSSTAVQLQLASGTAESGRDFATTGLTVSFDGGRTFSAVTGSSVTVPAGVTGFKLRVPSIEDSSVEGSETFTLQASANGATASGIGTILDDDRPINPNDVSFKGDTRIVEGNPAHVFTVKLAEAVTEDTWVTVRVNDGSAQRIDGDGSGQNYVKDQAVLDGWRNILTNSTAGTASLTRDFTVYGTDGQAVAGDTVRVLIPAGSNESQSYSVRAWQETQRVAQLGSAYEGNEEFRMAVTDVGSQALAQPAAVTVTVVDNHVQLISPIIIDLNGDGVRTTSLEHSQARFDMDLDGVKDRTGWISADDAFLAVDSNRDGQINDRSELFGGQIGEGFAKLASFDSNRDGRVDAGDQDFSALKVWQDRDGDGTTDEGELIALSDAGIASLRVSHENRAEDQNGNMLLERSEAMTVDGQAVEMADAYFAVDSGADAPRIADLLADARNDEIPLGGLVPAGSSGTSTAGATLKPVEPALEAHLDLENLLHKPQAHHEGS